MKREPYLGGLLGGAVHSAQHRFHHTSDYAFYDHVKSLAEADFEICRYAIGRMWELKASEFMSDKNFSYQCFIEAEEAYEQAVLRGHYESQERLEVLDFMPRNIR